MRVVQEKRHRRLGGEHELPGQQPVGHAAGRIDVHAPVEIGSAQRLLGRDERRRAVDDVLLRQRGLGLRACRRPPSTMPKSSTFTKSQSSPYRQTKMFAGLMSRWTSPHDSASESEWHTWRSR